MINIMNSHKMIIRSKAGVTKPKAFVVGYKFKAFRTIKEALENEGWYQAMIYEYKALMRSNLGV